MLRRSLRALALALPLLFAPSVASCAAPLAPATAAEAGAPHGPPLWKVADEDTTIYLFGTIHALPPVTEWYDGKLAAAVNEADELVTEVAADELDDPHAPDRIALGAVLPPGQSMRDMLSPKDRAVYEAAMRKIGRPLDAFDRFAPWYAGVALSMAPLLMNGYEREDGVEKVIETHASPAVRHVALETVEDQIAVFETLPPKVQIRFLVSVARSIDDIVPQNNAAIREWLAGNAERLAATINGDKSEKALAEALIYKRNYRWADWVAARLEQPGTVFMAVGAGHLAGRRSVLDTLARRGFTVTRVQ